jgi:hypothetical protein
MKEYIITFEKGGVEKSIRRYLSGDKYKESLIHLNSKTRDRNGIMLVSIEEIKGITPSQFIKSII